MILNRHSLIVIGALIACSEVVSNGQVPRRPREVVREADELTRLPREAGLPVPQAPDLGKPNVKAEGQEVTIAPVLNADRSSLGSSNHGGTSTGEGSPVPTGGAGYQTEDVIANRLRHLEIDPASDQVIDTRKGTVWNIFDNRGVDARYERYLNLGAEEAKLGDEYLSQLNELLQRLVPSNPYATVSATAVPDRQAMADAYASLRKLATHPADHGISTVIANNVDAVYKASADRKRLYAHAEQLEKEIERLEWNQSVVLKKHLENSLDRVVTRFWPKE